MRHGIWSPKQRTCHKPWTLAHLAVRLTKINRSTIKRKQNFNIKNFLFKRIFTAEALIRQKTSSLRYAHNIKWRGPQLLSARLLSLSAVEFCRSNYCRKESEFANPNSQRGPLRRQTTCTCQMVEVNRLWGQPAKRTKVTRIYLT